MVTEAADTAARPTAAGPVGLAAAAKKMLGGLKGFDATKVEVADDEQAPPTVRSAYLTLTVRLQWLAPL